MNKIFNLLGIIAIVVLAFVGGAVVVLAEVFPYDYLDDARRALIALYKQKTDYKSPYQSNLWRPARTDERGVTIYKPARTYDGFTLYSSSHAQKAFLITMEGKIAHEWNLPIAAVWENPDRQPRPDPYVFWEYPHLYSNGDLLVLYVGMGDTPWGYGLVKMDKNSKVIWKYFDNVHHHLDVAKDSKIYVLTNDIRNSEIERKRYRHLAPPRIDDSVVVLSPDGKLLKKVSIMDALLRSPYARMLQWGLAWNIEADFLHTNSIEVIDRATASKLPFAKAGQVLLSMREIDAVGILDLETEEIVWAAQGSWHRQHDADMLPNGNILLFDNWGNYEPGGSSRVVEFNPRTSKIIWNYAGDGARLLASPIRSGQERLPNGNTLITESDGGRIIEVTANGEIVWEYVNSVRGGKERKLIPVLSQGIVRIAPEKLALDFLEAINGSETAARENAGN